MFACSPLLRTCAWGTAHVTHCCEDGMWAVLAWLQILAVKTAKVQRSRMHRMGRKQMTAEAIV
eukprot:2371901-Amphidinium_carterae.1